MNLKNLSKTLNRSRLNMAYNGLRLDAGRELEVQKLSISKMFNRITKAEFITNALLAFKPMLGVVIL